MNIHQASRTVRQMLTSGYSHYSRKWERNLYDYLLLDLNTELPDIPLKLEHFDLAEQPKRSAKNNYICFIAAICRHAADLGANDIRCYALSDYYIREIEKTEDVRDWAEIIPTIITHYSSLVAEGRSESYSLPIVRALRYIQQNVYKKLTLKEIARAIDLNPNYLSNRFKEEVGTSITDYIRTAKMEEAQRLLQDSLYSIVEIAEILGYCNASYFAKVYRQVYGHSPRKRDPIA